MDFENEILESIETKGYFIIPSFFSDIDVQQMRNWIDEIANWEKEPGKQLNYYELVEGKKVLSRTENFLPFHHDFNALIKKSNIFSLAEKILKEPPFLFKEKINYKYKGTGKYNPHQDIHAHDMSPLAFQEYHLNCTIFVDDATLENGCLEVAPGYKGQLLQKNPDGSIVPEICNKIPWIPLEVKAGTVMFFNCWIPHKSELNRSDKPRRTIYLTFNGVSKGDFREAHYWDRASKKGKTKEINPDLFIES